MGTFINELNSQPIFKKEKVKSTNASETYVHTNHMGPEVDFK